MAKKKALGKGLSALITEEPAEIKELSGQPTHLPLNQLQPGNFQPRMVFTEEALSELAESIKETGVVQPIVVRQESPEKYQIIAGERRWRASKLAGKDTIPAIIQDVDDQTALEIALVENIQRQSLTPIEEAEGYQRLIHEFNFTQEQLAEKMGKSRSHVSNLLRILELPGDVKSLVNEGSLSMGHARALIKSNAPSDIAHEIVKKGLSVRQAETFAAGYGHQGGSKKAKKVKQAQTQDKDSDLIAIEQALTHKLGLRVTIDSANTQDGVVSVHYDSLKSLDLIIQKLGSDS